MITLWYEPFHKWPAERQSWKRHLCQADRDRWPNSSRWEMEAKKKEWTKEKKIAVAHRYASHFAKLFLQSLIFSSNQIQAISPRITSNYRARSLTNPFSLHGQHILYFAMLIFQRLHQLLGVSKSIKQLWYENEIKWNKMTELLSPVQAEWGRVSRILRTLCTPLTK